MNLICSISRDLATLLFVATLLTSIGIFQLALFTLFGYFYDTPPGEKPHPRDPEDLP